MGREREWGWQSEKVRVLKWGNGYYVISPPSFLRITMTRDRPKQLMRRELVGSFFIYLF